MADYVESTKIEIYPTANRGPVNSSNLYNPGSHQLTENNLTGLGHHITERSFVITDSYIEGKDFEFCIRGYYFKLLNFVASNLFEGNSQNGYASIRIEAQNPGAIGDAYSDPNYVLVTWAEGGTPGDSLDDVSGECLAVKFSTSAPTATSGLYTLHILEKVGGSWKIPATSHLKLNSHDIKGGEEDGEEFGLDTYLHTNKVSTNNLTSDTGNIATSTSLTLDPTNSITTATIIGNNSDSAYDLKVEGSTNLEGSLSTTSDVTVGNELHVVNDSKLDGAVDISGNTSVGGSLTVDSTSIFKNDVKINKSLSVTGSGSFEKGLTVGDVSTFDKFYANEVHATRSFTAGGNVVETASGNGRDIAISASPLRVEGPNVLFSGYPYFTDGLDLGRNFRVDSSGLVSGSKDLKINAPRTVLTCPLKVEGSAVFTNNVTADTMTVDHVSTPASLKSVPNIDYMMRNTGALLKYDTSRNVLSLWSQSGVPMSEVEMLPHIVNMVYPIGAIYISVSSVSPNTLFPGTSWTAIPGGLALWTIEEGQTAGTAYDGQLPPLPDDSGSFIAYGREGSSGSFTTEQQRYIKLDYNTLGTPAVTRVNEYTFKNTTAKGVYGATPYINRVRPSCYTVYMWRRES